MLKKETTEVEKDLVTTDGKCSAQVEVAEEQGGRIRIPTWNLVEKGVDLI